MRLAVSLCIGVIISSCLDSVDAQQQFQNGNVYNAFIDNLFGRRIKRASILAGQRALKYILDGATHMYSFGRKSLFVKHGEYKDALKDFKAVEPTHVEVVHDVHGVVRLTGQVGDKTITMEKGLGTKSTTLRITKNCCELYRKKFKNYGENIVIYTKPEAKPRLR